MSFSSPRYTAIIPQEIQDLVIDETWNWDLYDPETMKTWCLVSRGCLLRARYWLFKHVEIHICEELQEPYREKEIDTLKSLLHSPHSTLGPHLKRLDLTGSPWASSSYAKITATVKEILPYTPCISLVILELLFWDNLPRIVQAYIESLSLVKEIQLRAITFSTPRMFLHLLSSTFENLENLHCDDIRFIDNRTESLQSSMTSPPVPVQNLKSLHVVVGDNTARFFFAPTIMPLTSTTITELWLFIKDVKHLAPAGLFIAEIGGMLCDLGLSISLPVYKQLQAQASAAPFPISLASNVMLAHLRLPKCPYPISAGWIELLLSTTSPNLEIYMYVEVKTDPQFHPSDFTYLRNGLMLGTHMRRVLAIDVSDRWYGPSFRTEAKAALADLIEQGIVEIRPS